MRALSAAGGDGSGRVGELKGDEGVVSPEPICDEEEEEEEEEQRHKTTTVYSSVTLILLPPLPASARDVLATLRRQPAT